MEKSLKKSSKCEKCGKPIDRSGEELIEYNKRSILHFVECKECGHMNLVYKENR